MSRQAVLVRPLYRGYLAGGLATTPVELNFNLQNIVGGAAFASKTNIEYAIWSTVSLGSLGAPVIKGNAETTDAAGKIVIDVTGYLQLAVEAIVMLRQAAGATGGADDNWAACAVTVSAT